MILRKIQSVYWEWCMRLLWNKIINILVGSNIRNWFLFYLNELLFSLFPMRQKFSCLMRSLISEECLSLNITWYLLIENYIECRNSQKKGTPQIIGVWYNTNYRKKYSRNTKDTNSANDSECVKAGALRQASKLSQWAWLTC